MGAIHDEDVNASVNQRLGTIPFAFANAECGANAQATGGIGAAIGKVFGFFNVFNRQQALKLAVAVDDGEFFDPVFMKEFFRVFMGGAGDDGDKAILRRHDAGNRLIVVFLKAEIPVGQYANKSALFVGNRHPGNMIARHEFFGVLNLSIGCQGKGVGDGARLGTLHLVHLGGLIIDGQILVDDSDATLLGDTNCQAGFRHGIHRRADEGDVERDVSGQPCREIDISRQHV